MKNEVIIPGGEDLYAKIATLKEIKIDSENWLIYYIDEKSNEKWVEEKPHSEMHGGGPSQLRLLDKFPWEDDGSA